LVGQLAARPAKAVDRRAEFVPIHRRTTRIYLAILAAVAAALLVCLWPRARSLALFIVALSIPVAVLFILAMCAPIVGPTVFLREIFLAVRFGRAGAALIRAAS